MITISFRVTEDEARNIRTEARRERLSVSEFLRRRATTHPDMVSKLELQRCPLTNALIFTPTSPLSPLTVESTREMLA